MTSYPETITTPRMRGERISDSHFDEICLLHRDPVVMKTLSANGLPLSDEETRASLFRHADHWDQHGFGLWVFYDRKSNEFIGRGGLMRFEIDGVTEIGLAYAVVSQQWNRGIATEMATAAIAAGFKSFNGPTIASWTLPVNHTSQRVMEKLGFRYERDTTFADLPHRFFRLTRADWQSRIGPSTATISDG